MRPDQLMRLLYLYHSRLHCFQTGPLLFLWKRPCFQYSKLVFYIVSLFRRFEAHSEDNLMLHMLKLSVSLPLSLHSSVLLLHRLVSQRGSKAAFAFHFPSLFDRFAQVTIYIIANVVVISTGITTCQKNSLEERKFNAKRGSEISVKIE